MFSGNKFAVIRPEIVKRYQEAYALEQRYGPPSCARRHSSMHARSCRIDLLPRSIDVLSGTVVDVGANVGAWTDSLLAVVPSATVLAIEPADEPLAALRSRFGSDSRVEIAAVAVSDRSGSATFNVTDHSHNASLRTPLDMSADYGSGWTVTRTVTVPTVTLDALTDGRDLSLIKIDVQGAEGQVLAGARNTLARAKAVLLEVTLRPHYEGDLLFPKLHEIMIEHGYGLSGLSEPKKNVLGETLWLDACYVRHSPSYL